LKMRETTDGSRIVTGCLARLRRKTYMYYR
jgi:hypothetical protein